jgi:hypothetical protein
LAIVSSGLGPESGSGLLTGLAGPSRLALAGLTRLLTGRALLGTALAGLLTTLSRLSALTLSALATLAHSALALATLALPLAALLALTTLLALAALLALTRLLTTRLLTRPVHILIRHRKFPRIGCFVSPVCRKLIVADFVPPLTKRHRSLKGAVEPGSAPVRQVVVTVDTQRKRANA